MIRKRRFFRWSGTDCRGKDLQLALRAPVGREPEKIWGDLDIQSTRNSSELTSKLTQILNFYRYWLFYWLGHSLLKIRAVRIDLSNWLLHPPPLSLFSARTRLKLIVYYHERPKGASGEKCNCWRYIFRSNTKTVVTWQNKYVSWKSRLAKISFFRRVPIDCVYLVDKQSGVWGSAFRLTSTAFEKPLQPKFCLFLGACTWPPRAPDGRQRKTFLWVLSAWLGTIWIKFPCFLVGLVFRFGGIFTSQFSLSVLKHPGVSTTTALFRHPPPTANFRISTTSPKFFDPLPIFGETIALAMLFCVLPGAVARDCRVLKIARPNLTNCRMLHVSCGRYSSTCVVRRSAKRWHGLHACRGAHARHMFKWCISEDGGCLKQL